MMVAGLSPPAPAGALVTGAVAPGEVVALVRGTLGPLDPVVGAEGLGTESGEFAQPVAMKARTTPAAMPGARRALPMWFMFFSLIADRSYDKGS